MVNSQPGLGRRVLWLITFCTGLFLSALLQAEDETQLKAAFIYNFTKYVTWPRATEQANGELRLCAHGQGAYSAELAQLDGRVVRSFTLNVIETPLNDTLNSCHLVYISGKGSHDALLKTRNKAILTISDAPDFVDRGGMIGLVKDGRRIRFDVNLKRSKDSELQISSKLLQLARRVL
jgi:hypothetical protein